MHDAQNLFDASTSYAGEWNVDETLDSINAKVIIVGIETIDKRIDELTPFKNQKYGGDKADDYLDFIVDAANPVIAALQTNDPVDFEAALAELLVNNLKVVNGQLVAID